MKRKKMKKRPTTAWQNEEHQLKPRKLLVLDYYYLVFLVFSSFCIENFITNNYNTNTNAYTHNSSTRPAAKNKRKNVLHYLSALCLHSSSVFFLCFTFVFYIPLFFPLFAQFRLGTFDFALVYFFILLLFLLV